MQLAQDTATGMAIPTSINRMAAATTTGGLHTGLATITIMSIVHPPTGHTPDMEDMGIIARRMADTGRAAVMDTDIVELQLP